jgi:hypothetical protein
MRIYIFCLFCLAFVPSPKPATQDTVKTGFSWKSTAKIQRVFSPPTRMIPFQIDTSIQVHWMALLSHYIDAKEYAGFERIYADYFKKRMQLKEKKAAKMLKDLLPIM